MHLHVFLRFRFFLDLDLLCISCGCIVKSCACQLYIKGIYDDDDLVSVLVSTGASSLPLLLDRNRICQIMLAIICLLLRCSLSDTNSKFSFNIVL